MIVPGEEVGY
jgi:N-acetylglucosamine-6-phosphate deacetylase